MCPAPIPDHLRPLRVEIGRRVRDSRKAAGLSQEQLAERLGADHKTISRIESGTVSPRVDRLLDIALALDVVPARLMPGGPER